MIWRGQPDTTATTSQPHLEQKFPLLEAPQLQQPSKQADSERCSSATRFRADSSTALRTSQTSPAEATASSPTAAGGAADPCRRAGWCVAQTQTDATSQRSMPPADPGRPSKHVTDSSLMLPEQLQSQEQAPSMHLTSLPHAAVQAASAVAQAAAVLAAQQSEQTAGEAPKHRPQQSGAAGTDSEDDSWTPGQQPQTSSVDEQGDTQPEEEASADGSSDDDMMAAAAYDDLDEGMDADEVGWDPHMPPPVYCTNCTARIYISDRCSDCGHSSEQDSQLLSCDASSPDAAAAPAGDCPLIVWDESMLLHEEGKLEPHPERPDRLRAVMAQLNSNGLTGLCQRMPARLATKHELLRVHTPDHLHRLQLFCSGQVPPSAIPSDTYINQHTLQCAAVAAGSAAEVAVRVWQGEAPCGAAIIRPPGHHAESNTAMGFCFFNNAAVAARAVQEAGAQRVLILDWDVHHGNGTQHIFEHDDSVMYMSLHRYDRGTFYPGTGGATEVGRGNGEGFTVNVPWDTDGVSDCDYMAAMQQVLLPIAREFAPDIVLISAGFDAAAGDPIGGCNLTPECFGAMTAALMPVAPTVLLLEGGYNLRSTALSTEACLRVLLGEPASELEHSNPSPYAWFSIEATRKAHSRYWACLKGSRQQLQMQFPAGWGAAAAAPVGKDDQQQQGSDLELQYDDEYEEADYESVGEGAQEEEQGADDADANAAAQHEGAGGEDARGYPGHHHQQRREQQQQRRAVVRLGSKCSADNQEEDVDAHGGVDASRRVKTATAAGGLPPYLQRAAASQHSKGSNRARPLVRNSSSASASSGAFAGSRQGGAGRVFISRKQQMLKAIHKRATQLFLRKQRQVRQQRLQEHQQA